MKKWLAFITAVIIFFTLHEGLHALTALPFGEFEAFHIRILGLEVTFNTPIGERTGWHWALISGASNLATITLGYILLGFGKKFNQIQHTVSKAALFYLTLMGLLLDPLNLSVGPLLYGGDAGGISMGAGIPVWSIQIFFGLVFLIDRELVAGILVPAYEVETDHFLLRPWFRGINS